MSKNPQVLRLLIRYIIGEATENEQQRVKRWLKRDAANQQLLQTLEQLLHERKLDLSRWNENELWNELAVKTGIALSQAEPSKEVIVELETNMIQRLIGTVVQWTFGTNRSAFQYVVRFAVVLLLILGGVVGTAIHLKQLQEKRELAYQSTYQEYCTQKGERATLLLGDGTNIRLNSATKIRFPILFAKDKREIFLDGEAFFDVTHNESSPFIIHTADANVRVVGTKFDLSSYSDDNNTQLVVTEGQVAFGGVKQQNVVLLNRNQMSRIIKGGLPSTAEVIRTDRYLAWLKNQMVFDNATFADVIKQLSRKFDVEFKVHDSDLLNKHIVATYGTESLSQIMRSLSFSLRFQYDQRGRVVSLYLHKDSKAFKY